MSTVTTDDDDANEADKEAELLVDPRDPRERKEPLDLPGYPVTIRLREPITRHGP